MSSPGSSPRSRSGATRASRVSWPASISRRSVERNLCLAIAASGTVILELALAGVPSVSVYQTDWIIKLLASRIKVWTAALPNLIADYCVVPEYIDHTLRAGSLTRWAERLSVDTLQRQAMIEGFDLVQRRLTPEVPAGEAGARILLETLRKKSP